MCLWSVHDGVYTKGILSISHNNGDCCVKQVPQCQVPKWILWTLLGINIEVFQMQHVSCNLLDDGRYTYTTDGVEPIALRGYDD